MVLAWQDGYEALGEFAQPMTLGLLSKLPRLFDPTRFLVRVQVSNGILEIAVLDSHLAPTYVKRHQVFQGDYYFKTELCDPRSLERAEDFLRETLQLCRRLRP